MDQCKRDGCWSYAINDHKESGLCDKCYWIEQAEKLTAEREKLKAALDAAIAFIDCHAADPDITAEMRIKYAKYQEALKESA